MRGGMGNGVCSRRQRRVLQILVLLAVVLGILYGAMVNYELQKQLKRTETMALKYQQHQESMSAQLQVVYEHRSRLEKSLQKERLEHKKVKEDFLVYKLEAQETLNKGRQDSNNRYGALNVQHQMLKSQHEELKKQHSDLQAEHQKLGEDLTRAFSNHKQKYSVLEQEKEQELSKMKENVYNLQEENKHLRKAHQDVHTQLQDVKQQHKNLLTQHDHVLLALEDHKSALAAAQSQAEEYRVLKDALKKMPNLQQTDGSMRSSQRQQTHLSRNDPSSPAGAQQKNAAVTEPHKNEEKPQNQERNAEPGNTQNRPVEGDVRGQPKTEAEMDHPTEADTQHRTEEVEEHRKELEEEEMEQVGKAERLIDEQDQVQEEHEWKAKTQQHEHAVETPQFEENGQEHEEEQTNLLKEQMHSQRNSPTKPVQTHKSAYEEQLEQQRLMAQRAEEARRLKERQDALQAHLLKQQQLREQRLALSRRNQHQEQPLPRNPLRQQAPSDNLDHDIVHGEEQDAQEEGGAYESKDKGHTVEEVNIVDPDVEVPVADQHQADAGAEEENPANDPNNQGEDEFEEAKQEREENPPDENEPSEQNNQKPGNPGVEEHLVMAGNPDQQEDNIDEQYQEEGEEEAQEDMAVEKKKEAEHNGDEPYGENEDNANEKNSEIAEKELEGPEKNTPKEALEENYEEEEEEDDEGGAMVRTNRKAEM